MDIKNLLAIDVHTHAEVSSRNSGDPLWQAMQEASARYFPIALRTAPAKYLAKHRPDRDSTPRTSPLAL